MSETTDNRIECQSCRGSGMLEDGPCFACEGRGWFESESEPEDENVDFDFSILGDEFGGAAGSSIIESVSETGTDIFGGGGSGSILDEAGPAEGPPGLGGPSTKEAPSTVAPLDPEEEFEQLQKEHDRIERRFAVLEALLENRPGSKIKRRPEEQKPKDTAAFAKLLEKSRLLDGKELRVALAMANDPKDFAKRLLEAKMLTKWQVTQLLRGRSEFLVGKHKLMGVIAPGSMGAVFLARHITMKRPVAVKIFSGQLAQDSPFLERFLSLTRALGALDHRNVVHIYSADRLGNSYYLAMEYVKGRTLRHLVEEEGPLKFAAAADCVCQIAAGLQYLHDNNIRHEEIRPAKLLRDQSKVVKIAHPGIGGKSLNYMAPECAGGGGAVDHRADIFSLGCTLYFLLTGAPPFPEDASLQDLRKLHQADVKSLRSIRRKTPDPLSKLCAKMMARSPDHRFPSCEAIVVAMGPLIKKLVKADQ